MAEQDVPIDLTGSGSKLIYDKERRTIKRDGDSRTVHDPFLNKDVEVSDRLTDRLRGRYANGPTMANGEPEFGWREFPTPSVQHEAARALDALEFDLRETLRAVLHFYGPEGANKITTHVMMARKAKASNDEIDQLEKVLGEIVPNATTA